MIGELIVLPLRVGVRATRLWLRIAEETVNLAASATGRVIGCAASRGSGGSSSVVVPTAERRSWPEGDSREEAWREVSARDVQADAAAALERDSPATARMNAPERSATLFAQQPTHVSEEPALVEEFSEPGAEDGAGAEIHVEEPWDGYAQMNARQVIDRVSTTTPAVLAAVQLYESTHRRRQTVLNAVERELRSANGSSQRK